MKVSFYCDQNIKCNNQPYFCSDCIEKHPHQPVVISKANQMISKLWMFLFEQVETLQAESKKRYEQFKDIIDYCELFKDEIALSTHRTIGQDYKELLKVIDELNKEKNRVEQHAAQYSLKFLLDHEPIREKMRAKIQPLDYLKDITEIDIWMSYKNIFTRDIIQPIEMFSEKNFRLFILFKFKALSEANQNNGQQDEPINVDDYNQISTSTKKKGKAGAQQSQNTFSLERFQQLESKFEKLKLSHQDLDNEVHKNVSRQIDKLENAFQAVQSKSNTANSGSTFFNRLQNDNSQQSSFSPQTEQTVQTLVKQMQEMTFGMQDLQDQVKSLQCQVQKLKVKDILKLNEPKVCMPIKDDIYYCKGNHIDGNQQVYGTGIYLPVSDKCAAAVHWGAIDRKYGGYFKVKQEFATNFVGSLQNLIQSYNGETAATLNKFLMDPKTNQYLAFSVEKMNL
eukprot:403347024